ncbi:carboxylesterase 1-like [Sesbania bispinosa]|nr:carboxylesterase 1-like [Sesbania bispinosa]
MVRSRLPQVGNVPRSSPNLATTDSTSEPIPQYISLVIWLRLPLPRAASASTKYRKWISCIPFAE